MDDNSLFFTPSQERQPRADATRNRELLLATAHALFKRDGVARVTMSAIAEAAGVGKGTLYRHFADKRALCFALLDSEMHALQVRVFDHLRRPLAPEEKLRWFLQEVAQHVHEHLDLLLAGQDSTLPQHPHAWWRQTIRGLLAQIPLQSDVEYWADTLYLMLEVNTLCYQLRLRGYTLARVCAGLNTLLDGVLACPR